MPELLLPELIYTSVSNSAQGRDKKPQTLLDEIHGESLRKSVLWGYISKE